MHPRSFKESFLCFDGSLRLPDIGSRLHCTCLRLRARQPCPFGSALDLEGGSGVVSTQPVKKPPSAFLLQQPAIKKVRGRAGSLQASLSVSVSCGKAERWHRPASLEDASIKAQRRKLHRQRDRAAERDRKREVQTRTHVSIYEREHTAARQGGQPRDRFLRLACRCLVVQVYAVRKGH